MYDKLKSENDHRFYYYCFIFIKKRIIVHQIPDFNIKAFYSKRGRKKSKKKKKLQFHPWVSCYLSSSLLSAQGHSFP